MCGDVCRGPTASHLESPTEWIYTNELLESIHPGTSNHRSGGQRRGNERERKRRVECHRSRARDVARGRGADRKTLLLRQQTQSEGNYRQSPAEKHGPRVTKSKCEAATSLPGDFVVQPPPAMALWHTQSCAHPAGLRSPLVVAQAMRVWCRLRRGQGRGGQGCLPAGFRMHPVYLVNRCLGGCIGRESIYNCRCFFVFPASVFGTGKRTNSVSSGLESSC